MPNLRLRSDLSPRYNIAPTQETAAILNDGRREIRLVRWGLIPQWAKDPSIGAQLINARAETLAEKPSFRVPLKKQRCLIPADGFYEWTRGGKGKTKTPVYFKLKSGDPFAFAGLWDCWMDDDSGAVITCTIITTAANELAAKVHDRMPAILKAEDCEDWINPAPKTYEELKDRLTPYPAEQMEFYPVSNLVNNPRTDSPECIRPAAEEGPLL